MDCRCTACQKARKLRPFDIEVCPPTLEVPRIGEEPIGEKLIDVCSDCGTSYEEWPERYGNPPPRCTDCWVLFLGGKKRNYAVRKEA